MDDMMFFCGAGELGNAFVEKFWGSTGGTFSHHLLNKKFAEHGSIINFGKLVSAEIEKEIEKYGDSVELFDEIQMGSERPKFNIFDDRFSRLTILINDTQHTEIHIDNLVFNEATGSWHADVNFTITDGFGLNDQDLTYQNAHFGFPSWWALQRMRYFTPFQSVVSVSLTLSGSID